MHVNNSYGQKYPIFQYADDNLITMPADPIQLVALQRNINNFSAATRLKVNFLKSSFVPINMSSERCSSVAQILGCMVESMPFTYLGLPLGTTQPRIDDIIYSQNRYKTICYW